MVTNIAELAQAREIEELKHDIDRHLTICSEQAREIAELKARNIIPFYSIEEIRITKEALFRHANAVEEDGHITAARHMRTAADMLHQARGL